jgi:hypothetical protein
MKQQQQNPNSNSTLPSSMGSDEGVQGDGNYEAARRYNEAAQGFTERTDVERAMRVAQPVSPAEAVDLERAEAAGRSHAREEDPLLNDPTPQYPAENSAPRDN